MSPRAKFVSLFLLVLLVLPAILSPIQQGSVLGVQENKASGQVFEDDNSGSIAGGVMENKSEVSSNNNSKVGFAVLDSETTTPVTAKDFKLASEITATFNDKKTDLIISKVDSGLAEGVVLVVNKDIFTQLGGNPEVAEKIQISVQPTVKN